MSRRLALLCAAAAFATAACGERTSDFSTTTPGADRADTGHVVASAEARGVPLQQEGAAVGEGERNLSAATTTVSSVSSRTPARAPNELGRIPVLEYHLIGDGEARWKVSRQRFRENLALLYERGYRPVSVTQLLDKQLDLPVGLSPVVIVFDDASPGQFSYVERNGQLEVDPNSAVGMLLDFHKQHSDWENRAVFCMLPAAQQGHAFFGDRGIAGQKSEWRFKKVQYLKAKGFELCNHTLYHANLGKQTDEKAQEFIARGHMAIDSAVPDYNVRTFALPLGVWPKNKARAWAGSWRDPKSGKTVAYRYDAVLEVSGGPTRSPHDPQFDPLHITRVEVFARQLEMWLDHLDRSGTRYVSDGDPTRVARPTAPPVVARGAAPGAQGAAPRQVAKKPTAAKPVTKPVTKRVASKQTAGTRR